MITQNIFDKNLIEILKKTPKKIAVAVSGGSDSMALCLLTCGFAKKHNIEMTALTVNHNLRREAGKEALKVNKWLSKYSIKHEILEYKGNVPKSNIEAIAREYRYELIFDYMKKNKIEYLLLGHNMDEQRETFFLNLSRGSGVYGLSAMPEIFKKNSINLIRPMLVFTKDEIKYYLKKQKQKWVEDPSNKDKKYKRVRIRKLKKLIDELEFSNDRLLKTMNNMARTRDAIEFFVERLVKESVTKEKENIKIQRDKFISYPDEVSLRAIASIIQSFSKAKYPPRFESLEIVLDKIKNKTLKKGITLSKIKISSDKYDNIVLEKEIGRIKKTLSKKKLIS